MRGIFGIVRRTGAPLPSDALATMRDALPGPPADGAGAWSQDSAALARDGGTALPETRSERLPLYDSDAGLAFTASARLDNREDLLRELGLGAMAPLGDGEVVLEAYRRWGERAPARLFGDWAFAAWHPRERRLFLARDHLGHGSLYYYADANTFAFARSRRAIDALALARPELDELCLAQRLIAWPVYFGERTIAGPVRRLPPAHALTLTPDRLEVRRYWEIESVGQLHLAKRSDYVEAFGELFDAAVRTRSRPDSGSVGVTLSGGLDSGSVAVTAADSVDARLQAFTSVPLGDPGPYAGDQFGDELPLAQATAAVRGMELHAVDAADVTPLDGIRRGLEIVGEPIHAARNLYWIVAVLERARAAGCQVMLTGQQGNGGISWEGDPLSQPVGYQLRELGVRTWAGEWARRSLPPRARAARARRRSDAGWFRASAIHPAFARRLDLAERRLRDPDLFPRRPLERRLGNLLPARGAGGAIWAELGASFGVEVRDPTADVRLLEFVLAVPDHVFIDPGTGQDRWLIREAMRGRLPDSVRLNRRRGRQAADIVPRLRACSGQVETALDEIGRGPAAAYVDAGHMRDVWRLVEREDSRQAFIKATTVLTRGIMAGLYVNSLG